MALSSGGRIVPVSGSGQCNMKTKGAKNLRDQSSCHPHPPLLNLSTYNGRSLYTDDRLEELELELSKIKWDIVGLCEVRRKEEEKIELRSGHIFYYRGTEKGGQSGVGFIIHKRWKDKIIGFESTSDRVAKVVIQINKRYKIQIIQIYAPTSSYSDEVVEEFYEELSEINNKENHHLKIIMGDFNARIGEKQHGESAIGNFGYGRRDERGSRLVDFAEKEGLQIINSFFKKKVHRKYTWTSPSGNKSELDYILTNKKYIFQDCTVLNKFNTGSDHRMVRGKIMFDCKVKRQKLTKKGNRCNIDNQNLEKNKQKFQDEMNLTFEALINLEENPNLDNLNNILSKTLKDKAIKVAGRARNQQTGKISESTKSLINQRRNFIVDKNNPQKKIEYAELCKLTRKKIREDVKKFNNNLAQKAIENNKGLKSVKNKINIGRKGIFALKDENGILTKNNDEIIKIVENFYNKLYQDENKEEFNLENYWEDSDISPILADEVDKTIRTMKKGKSPGEDGTTIEILKAAGYQLCKVLAKLFNQCLNKSDIPKDWNNALMVILFKKGDKTDIKNYRPISLLSNFYKIFTGVLTKRLENTLESTQSKEQAGFRKHFSTLDHIQVIRETIERHVEYELPLCLAYIDYEKAFDSVKTSAVLSSLKNIGVETSYLKLLNTIYQKATATIEINNEKASIKLQKGVRQGDSISPKLFIAVLEEVFKQINWNEKGININGQRLNHLRFADDIVIISNCPNELNEMIEELEHASLKAGLKMNLHKTKVMFNSFVKKQPIKINDNIIEEVKEYIYLGQEITMEGNIANEIARRIRIGWATFGKNNIIFKSKMPLHLKRKVFDQCVLPAITYGCETWSLTKRAMQKLQTAQRSMERSMLGITRRDRKRITWIRSQTKVMDIVERIKRMKWKWAGHIARRTDERWTTQILQWYPRNIKRPRKRPKIRWRDEIKQVAGTRWQTAAQDRSVWKSMEETFVQLWTRNG
ncbi:hypothetical protein M8J77_001036 [Diaphorina citri]|nr:hypothetical protein M8J77_001036 [Diaphorina citri]